MLQVGSGSEVSFPSSSSSSGDSFSQQVTAAPGMMLGKRPAAALVSSPSSAKKKMPAPPAKAKRGRPRKSLGPSLLDEDSSDFVVVKSSPRKKRVLTEHQKSVMTSRHDDIPALYSELSRDDSIIQLPAEFQSQDSSLEPQVKEVKEAVQEVTEDAMEETEKAVNDTENISETEAEDDKISGTEQIEEFDSSAESESLLKKAKMKEMKNARFDPMVGTPTERMARSPRRSAWLTFL